MRSPAGLLSTLLFFVVAFPVPLAAQSITTEPVTAVPVSSPWLLLALWLTLLAGGFWLLRHRRPPAQAFVIAGIAAAGLWMMQPAGAQVQLQFSNPEGETAAIPINQILSGAAIQGFQRVDFQNTSGINLRIASVVEPDFDACFPAGLDEPLPAPTGSSGTACAAGLTLAPGDSCSVDVDTICRERAADAIAEIDVTPSPLTFVQGGTGVLTITTAAASPVPALDPAVTIPDGSGLTVQSTTCGASLARGASCQITLTAPAAETASVSMAGSNTATTSVTVNVTATPLADLSVAPAALSFTVGETGIVTVTNDAAIAASNVAATIPASSGFSVQSTTCGTSLAPSASCTITFTNATVEAGTVVTIAGDDTDTENVTLTTVAPPPADLSVAPAALSFTVGETGIVTVTNDSAIAASNVAATIPASSGFSVQSTTCAASLAPSASCTITFANATVEADTVVTIAGDDTDTENVTLTTVAPPPADLSVAPAMLTFTEGDTGVITVTNDSATAASNVAATIPAGSSFSVQSTTCGASLAPSASCTITFTNATVEAGTVVTIAGDDTDTENVTLTTVTQPTIAITGPLQASRVIGVGGAALTLIVTNNAGSAANATDITVIDKAAAPNVVVDDSDCASVAPGASCTLELSSATPYAPATITIAGGNTANSPAALIAFSYLGGLVFEESGGSGKVVIDVAQEFTSPWTAGLAAIAGASSLDDGVANTNAIVADAVCSGDSANCAAQRCRDIGADWYLPARTELAAIHGALCSNSAVPCNAGGFSSAAYWTSTQAPLGDAWRVIFPSGIQSVGTKSVPQAVRCARPF